MKLRPQTQSRTGASDTLGSGAELAGIVVVFFLIGFALDAWLDTRPLFMIVMVLFSMVGQFVKMYFVYSHQMQGLEKERATAARGGQR